MPQSGFRAGHDQQAKIAAAHASIPERLVLYSEQTFLLFLQAVLRLDPRRRIDTVSIFSSRALAQHHLQKSQRFVRPVLEEAAGEVLHDPVDVVQLSVLVQRLPVANVPRP